MTGMTPSEWQTHAAQCRKLAETMEDEAARRVLLEAAEDYMRTARREAATRALPVFAYQIDSSARSAASCSRAG